MHCLVTFIGNSLPYKELYYFIFFKLRIKNGCTLDICVNWNVTLELLVTWTHTMWEYTFYTRFQLSKQWLSRDLWLINWAGSNLDDRTMAKVTDDGSTWHRSQREGSVLLRLYFLVIKSDVSRTHVEP